jgi:hypothetical protein
VTPLDLVVDSLATHRITRLAVKDSLFQVPREKFVERFYSDAPHSVHRLAECPHCFSVHAAAFVALTHHRRLRFLRTLVYVLAIADTVSLYTEVVETFDPSNQNDSWGT